MRVFTASMLAGAVLALMAAAPNPVIADDEHLCVVKCCDQADQRAPNGVQPSDFHPIGGGIVVQGRSGFPCDAVKACQVNQSCAQCLNALRRNWDFEVDEDIPPVGASESVSVPRWQDTYSGCDKCPPVCPASPQSVACVIYTLEGELDDEDTDTENQL